MLFTSLLVSALAIGNTSTSPPPKRISAPIVDDSIILNFALTLEFLQRAFYERALAQFTQADFVAAGFEGPFYTNLQAIYSDEQNHVAFFVLALLAAGIEPTNELKYEFPYTDVASFVGLASVIEGVSVSAYVGALSSIEDADYLTAFGSILGVEARQSSYIRAGLGEAAFSNPFETPLDFQYGEAWSQQRHDHLRRVHLWPLEGSFIHLIEKRKSREPGNNEWLTHAQLPVLARIVNDHSDYMVDAIPTGVLGQAYVVLSKPCQDPSDENIVAGPAILEASCLRALRFSGALH
ncbi:MAG: hypothetical protein Q9175_002740 [Cornicularia normoerica]